MPIKDVDAKDANDKDSTPTSVPQIKTLDLHELKMTVGGWEPTKPKPGGRSGEPSASACACVCG